MSKDYLYTPAMISKMTNAEINKAYSRLRAIANKRVERLDRQNLNYNEIKKFATIQQVNESSKWDVGSQLAEVSRYLRGRSTVSAVKEHLDNMQGTLVSMGYGSLAKDYPTLFKTIKYLEKLRKVQTSRYYDSGVALDVAEQAQRLNIPLEKVLEDYDLFASNLEKMEQVTPTKGGRTFSKSRIEALRKKWTKK